MTLHDYQATACTDVTGFGLLGHLVEMTRASEVDVTLELRQLPWLDGAQETVSAGLLSAICPPDGRWSAGQCPTDCTEACLAALHTHGYDRAAIIGTVQPQTHPGESITIVGL